MPLLYGSKPSVKVLIPEGKPEMIGRADDEFEIAAERLPLSLPRLSDQVLP